MNKSSLILIILFSILNVNGQIIKHGELQSYTYKQGDLTVTISSPETVLFDSVKVEINLKNSGSDTMLVFDSEKLNPRINQVNNFLISLGTSAARGIETNFKMYKIFPKDSKKYHVVIQKDSTITSIPQRLIFTFFDMLYIPKLKNVKEYIAEEKQNKVMISSMSLAFNSYLIGIGGLMFEIH